MSLQNLFSELPETSEETIQRAHRAAVALGSDHTGEPAESERLQSCQTLMGRAAGSLLDLALRVQAFELSTDIAGDPAHHLLHDDLVALRRTSAGAVRSAWRALDVHGREVGYVTDRWRDAAVDVTAAVLGQSALPLGLPRHSPTDVTRAAHLRLLQAIEAVPYDRMAVPGHLATAIGLAAAPFMLACELLDR